MKGTFVFTLILLFAFIQTTHAQDDLNSSEDDYLKQAKTEAGFVFTMAETGSGFGAFMALPFGSIFHVGAIVDAYFLRDSKQFEYMDPYTGGIYSINKVNDVYIFDLMLTLKRRFFAEDMHDSFRPFISGGFGPVFGMNFPEDESKNDQKEWSFGGFVGAGADVSVDRKFFISVRAQYKILPFSKPLGERINHSMFELRFEIGKRF
ncbi:MAG: outer membrane beta-barrel protein [Calditrichia bacterium]|nr:outer membrane beta-barrel protein [Calditrichia bacterium]